VTLSLSAQRPRHSILLVDGDEWMRAALYYAFSPSYRVTLAVDGLDGYARASQLPPPDVIITDVILPRLDGVEMALRLREISALRAVPIIFMTGGSSTENLGLAPPRHLAFACVPKSAHLFVLRKKVESALAAMPSPSALGEDASASGIFPMSDSQNATN
jgi:CheY-like chemotaxis protein